MSNFIIFAVGLAVTLVTAMGVLTSLVFVGYKASYKAIIKNNNLERNHI